MTQMSDLNNFLWDIHEIYNPGGHKTPVMATQHLGRCGMFLFTPLSPAWRSPYCTLDCRKCCNDSSQAEYRIWFWFAFFVVACLRCKISLENLQRAVLCKRTIACNVHFYKCLYLFEFECC